MPEKLSGKYGSSITRKCPSKYNPIERCWAVLENYWNGAILDSIDAALNWASNMTWKGIKPLVHLVEGTYEKGVKVLAKN
ncbi:ISAzo13-like element transposase-related protein [Microcystis aeruginosa]|uniref:Transposase n=2 Tax=Microcystis TaxID=1125 RepID=A0A552HUN2_MICVR|nr:hypothetical protein [Microcystis aeruginosa]TRU68946.1 MAG: hypothetical protein EWV55_22275 [Microcystis viridis Mv_BB_P_19951000_S69]TRU70734.1 MAG: hypothetical protein EWV47_18240 [Microcystis viridis Mv_BB_P_19951000_S68]TRU74923.1 MAG: hypothetical protein EWV77_09410 [Microcystis viridis Mv_BB_P_19951000_S68D]TRU87091.1 MAG: hypothetical protein EWV46_08725 [Microcystis viridis Mv_BB_P_19951000_S69D]QGZ88749.1 hypothetical protein GQR42_03075 [Microcystis aeruginosa FD4]